MPADLLPAADLVEIRRSAVANPALKVLFVTNMWPDRMKPHYGPFVASQALSLEAIGIAVDVLAIRGYVSARAYAQARRRLLGYVRDTRPALVHVHTGHAASIGLLGVPAARVVSFVGGDLLGHPKHGGGLSAKSRAEVQLFRRIAHLADATITKSQEMAEVLPMRVRLRNHVIPNGVDLEQFRPRDRATARQRLGWPPGERVALFLGDPGDPRKNVELARAAIAALAGRRLHVRLHTGWGARPEEIPDMMAAANALVLPSISEGSPNVVKEAMASALPVVATPVGDVRERFQGVGGCFVAEPDATAFAAALAVAVNEPPALAARAVTMSLGLDAVARRIENVYGLALRRRHAEHHDSP